MKQIIQHLNTGKMELVDIPCPSAGRGLVLIKTSRTLISAGTERMLIEFSKSNLLQKARSQPEKVKQVLDKMRTDGLMPTLEAVFRKLDEPLPLGYCNTGRVLEVGSGVSDLAPGDRVASNGNHAEIVCVPRNLVTRIPDGVTDESAAFTVLGAIALHGVRLAKPAMGERFMVFGMGLLGLMTVQLLRANGCDVMAVDVNSGRLALAARFGARTVDLSAGEDPVVATFAWTGGVGIDGVLITASAKNDEIMHQAAEASRKRGRIVLVGVVGLDLRRDDFYKKELTFQVSCSYGPGRYDEAYEQGGRDYPIQFVRWTEGRNFEAVLSTMASGALNVEPLVTNRFPLDEALTAYNTIQHDASVLGVVLEYPESVNTAKSVRMGVAPGKPERQHAGAGSAVIGVIGAGNFAKATLLPALVKTQARLAYVADINSVAAQDAARKFNAVTATTDYRLMLDDPEVQAVFILVGHHLHARFICEALEAGKHVFVEKPLALNAEQLTKVVETAKQHPDRIVMVGFNRRFSLHAVRIKKLLAGRSEPLTMSMTVNAGMIPPDHWTQNPEIGGGRIIGEGCHFIDLLSFLTGSPVRRVSAMIVGKGLAVREDKMSIMLGFADGSVGTVHYFANGSKSYPKEMLEVFSEGRVLRMENFRQTIGYGFKGFTKLKTRRQDKGHAAEVAEFIRLVSQGGTTLIPFDQLVNNSLATFAALKSALVGEQQSIAGQNTGNNE